MWHKARSMEHPIRIEFTFLLIKLDNHYITWGTLKILPTFVLAPGCKYGAFNGDRTHYLLSKLANHYTAWGALKNLPTFVLAPGCKYGAFNEDRTHYLLIRLVNHYPTWGVLKTCLYLFCHKAANMEHPIRIEHFCSVAMNLWSELANHYITVKLLCNCKEILWGASVFLLTRLWLKYPTSYDRDGLI